MLAGRNGVEEVRVGRQGPDFFFASEKEPSPTIIRGLMEFGPPGLQFKAVDQFVMRIPTAREQLLTTTRSLLELLDRLRQQAGNGSVSDPLKRDGKTP